MCSTISGPIPSWIRHHCMAKRQCMQVIADNMLHPTLDCLLSWSLLYNSMVNKTAQCACLTTKSLVAQCHAISAGRADVIDKTTRTAFGQRRARVRLKFSSGNGESPVKILFLCYHRNLIEIHLRVNDDSPNSNIPNKYRNAQDKKKQLLLKIVYLFNLFTHAFKTILAVYLRLLRIPKITLSTSFFSEFYDSSVSWLSCAIMAYSKLIGTCTVSIRWPFRHIRRRDRSDLWTSAAKLWVMNGDAILGQSRKVWVLSLLIFKRSLFKFQKMVTYRKKTLKNT